MHLSAWASASEDHRLGDFNNRNLMHTVLKYMVQVFGCSLLVHTSSWEEDVCFHTLCACALFLAYNWQDKENGGSIIYREKERSIERLFLAVFL